MAEIELVIKIDEKYLEYIHKAVEVDCTAPPYFVVRNLWESVLNGVPLPKGHGRLIDEEDMLSVIIFSKLFDDAKVEEVKEALLNIPTIIEGSDKE